MSKIMIPPQVGMRRRTSNKKIGQRAHQKKKGKEEKKRKKKREKENNKMREKDRRDNCYYLLFHTCASSSTIIFMIESLICCHFHILVGIFHYRTRLLYSYDGLPQMPQVFVSKQVGCTPTSFLLLSIYLQLQCIRCMAIPTPHVDIN